MTVEGATQFAMPPFLLCWIVERMNENREKKLVVHLQRKFGDFEVRQKQKVAVVENTSTQQTTTTQPKKGLPGFALTATPPPPKRPRQNRVIMANIRRDGNKVKRAARALHAEFTEQEFRKFIAVLLYTSSNQVKNLKDYWVKNPVTKSNHPLVRMLFSRDRFVSLYGCFRFEDEDLEKMEGPVQDWIQEVWEPATAAVVDETLVASKSRKNPHHVFIMRKPHPHGIKVWSLVDMSGYLVSFSVFRRNRFVAHSRPTYNNIEQKLLPSPKAPLFWKD